jgi:hypothetical protein
VIGDQVGELSDWCKQGTHEEHPRKEDSLNDISLVWHH